MDLGLKGKIVVITGGGSGIGRAAAHLFAAEGADVVIAGRSRERLDAAAADIQARAQARCIALACDVRILADIQRLFAQAEDALGGIDAVVNNVAGVVPLPYEQASEEHWRDALAQKLLGYVHTSTVALSYLRKRGGGRIVNVTGTAGREPNPWTTSTGIVNAGLANFTKTLSSQVAKDNILVNAVSPGPVDTGRWQGVTAGQGEAGNSVIEQTALRRLGRPEEVAAAIVFLASERASYITGATLTVDGGRSASVAF